ncbi:hypothetical protein [Anaerocolumna xylanovorans]|uniref:Permease n=1 Tax=Anaerocolumna xylanovorans DSM 12503 TaxID=1121345 RepID=A0A1M7YLQ2_9FIRM|nr:hypothetical protein [Anaerocolumna xylanovorans]SHO53550.1 hypothetical protein SAMN02745217_04157 [Anaerocolumna xylanovorans DSM 12503]
MFTIILYIIIALTLLVSFFKSKEKTCQALKYAFTSLIELLPKLIGLFLIITILLSYLNTEFVSKILGENSGVLGVFIACLLGSIVIIPTMIAYPMAAELLKMGAGYAQVTVFITTITMVGLLTLPMEIEFFRKNIAIKRNVLAIFFAILSSAVVTIIM